MPNRSTFGSTTRRCCSSRSRQRFNLLATVATIRDEGQTPDGSRALARLVGAYLGRPHGGGRRREPTGLDGIGLRWRTRKSATTLSRQRPRGGAGRSRGPPPATPDRRTGRPDARRWSRCRARFRSRGRRL